MLLHSAERRVLRDLHATLGIALLCANAVVAAVGGLAWIRREPAPAADAPSEPEQRGPPRRAARSFGVPGVDLAGDIAVADVRQRSADEHHRIGGVGSATGFPEHHHVRSNLNDHVLVAVRQLGVGHSQSVVVASGGELEVVRAFVGRSAAEVEEIVAKIARIPPKSVSKTDKESLRNLRNLRTDFGAYGPGGFYDAVDVSTGEMSRRYLSLDQGMVMAALGNALADDVMRRPFSRGAMEERVAPLMRMEEFVGVTGGRP